METTRATVDLDRNAGSFYMPAPVTLQGLAGATNTALNRVQRTFQRLKVWYDKTNGDISELLTLSQTNAGNITALTTRIENLETTVNAGGTVRNVINWTVNTNTATITVTYQEQTVLLLGSTSQATYSGTSCGGS